MVSMGAHCQLACDACHQVVNDLCPGTQRAGFKPASSTSGWETLRKSCDLSGCPFLPLQNPHTRHSGWEDRWDARHTVGGGEWGPPPLNQSAPLPCASCLFPKAALLCSKGNKTPEALGPQRLAVLL